VRCDLERAERDAGVALGVLDEERPGVGVEREARAAQAALRIGERAIDERAEVVGGQRLEDEDAGARQERGDDLERRVLGGGADEDDRAALDVRQERVLLRLVEAMDLVDEEQDRLAAAAQLVLGLRDHLSQLLHPVQHGGEPDGAHAARLAQQPRQRGLAGARRTPQDERFEPSARQQIAQDPAGAEEMLLADELVDRPRPHALRQRGAGRHGRRGRRLREQLRLPRHWCTTLPYGAHAGTPARRVVRSLGGEGGDGAHPHGRPGGEA
jgi:hypothetical protein